MLKQLSKEMNLEMVEQLMSDSAEGIAYQKEVDLALQSKITAGEEEEVQEELEKLLQEQVSTFVDFERWRLIRSGDSSLLHCLLHRSRHYQIQSSHRQQNKVRLPILLARVNLISRAQNSQQRKKNQHANQKRVKRCSLDQLSLSQRLYICFRNMQVSYIPSTSKYDDVARLYWTVLECLSTLFGRRCHSSSSTDDSHCEREGQISTVPRR